MNLPLDLVAIPGGIYSHGYSQEYRGESKAEQAHQRAQFCRLQSLQGTRLASAIALDRPYDAARQQNTTQRKKRKRGETNDGRQADCDAKEGSPLNMPRVNESRGRDLACRRRRRRNECRLVALVERLGLARSYSDLGSPASRTKRNGIFNRVPAAVTRMFHFFTLQEAPRSWQTEARKQTP